MIQVSESGSVYSTIIQECMQCAYTLRKGNRPSRPGRWRAKYAVLTDVHQADQSRASPGNALHEFHGTFATDRDDHITKGLAKKPGFTVSEVVLWTLLAESKIQRSPPPHVRHIPPIFF